jgi:hypothetical protein
MRSANIQVFISISLRTIWYIKPLTITSIHKLNLIQGIILVVWYRKLWFVFQRNGKLHRKFPENVFHMLQPSQNTV